MKRYAALIAGVALTAALLAACGGGGEGASTAGDELACAAAQGKTEQLADTKLIFEYQSTDNDTGVHGLLDASGWSELCVYAPDGRQILAVKPQGQLKDLTMSGIFFESREPLEEEVPQKEILARFPEGNYEVVATSFDGTGLTGTATLTHDIPRPPVVISPAEGDVVDLTNVVISWEPVTDTVDGDPVHITGYEIIVTNESVDDPHGFSRRILSAHVLPSVTSLTIPIAFLEPDTEYELEVIALEDSGNQTITAVFFQTQ